MAQSNHVRGSTDEPPQFGINNVITNLFVTWDADHLYVMLQGYEVENKLVVLMDVDPGNGTGATTTTNWIDTTGHQLGTSLFRIIGGVNVPGAIDTRIVKASEFAAEADKGVVA